jgi:hypothetical protein
MAHKRVAEAAGVVRIGDTVRRPMPERSEYVHDLLRMLAHYAWPGAPRYLGTDEEGREILSYLDGHVASAPAQPPEIWAEASLVRVSKLVRQFHDLTAGTQLAGADEVACHNTLAPRTTVYRDTGFGLRPYAFLDWDHAAPGRRIHDVAHLCWQFLELGPGRSSPDGPARLVGLIADSYDLLARDRRELVEAILWWQDRSWRGVETRAAAGDAAMVQLCADGYVTAIQEAHEWVTRHRAILEAAVT